MPFQATVDYVIVGVVGISVLTGLFRGFFHELVSLAVWGAAAWCGVTYHRAWDAALSHYISQPSVRLVVGVLAIIFLSFIVAALVNSVLGLLVKRSGLSGADRVLGIIFGFIRGVFIVCLLMVMGHFTSLDSHQYAKDSIFYPKLAPYVAWMATWSTAMLHQATKLEIASLVDDS